MMKRLMMSAISLLFIVGVAAGCTGGNNGGGAGDSSTEDTNVPPETSRTNATTEEADGTTEAIGGTTVNSTTSETGSVSLEQISSGTMGPEKRQILAASSAAELSAALGLRVPDSGEGTYVAVVWGEKPTGGYTVDFGSVSVKGVRLEIGVDLKDPPSDAMVAQALTYPYAVAVLRGVDLGEKELALVTQNGRELGWPVVNV